MKRGNDWGFLYKGYKMWVGNNIVELKVYDPCKERYGGREYYIELSIEADGFGFKNRFEQDDLTLEVFFIFLEQASKQFIKHLTKKEKETHAA